MAHAAIFLIAQPCLACIYFPDDIDPSQFKEVEREALMFRSKDDPGIVNLIVKSSLQGKLPSEMAWVLPFPSMPEVKEADPEIFSELRSYFAPKPIEIFGLRSKEAGAAAALPRSAIEIHSAVHVGNHEIVPIEIKDAGGAGEEMNDWLRGNGYIELPSEIQKPYLAKGAVFLAIKVRTGGEAMELKPLWISYKSDKMEFPLRFTHDYRTFDLNLYLIHDREPSAGISPMVKVAKKYNTLFPHVISGWLGAAEWGTFPPRTEIWSADVEEVAGWFRAFKNCASVAKGGRIERIFIPGVNTHFRTRDLQFDPGL
jgi:hypothetical protein